MNKAVLTALIITIIIVLAFVIFLCTLATLEEEEPSLLPRHYIQARILRPEPSITIHNGISY